MKKTALFLALALVPTVRASEPEKQPLVISLSVPVRDGGKWVDGDSKYRLHVIITNGSTDAVNICNDHCSWGYQSLSFELSDEKGGKWTVSKKPTIWYSNVPQFWTLQPHGQLALDADLGDQKAWAGMPLNLNRVVYTVRAVFEFKRDNSYDDIQKATGGKLPPVWTGRIVSKPEKIMFVP